MTSLNIRRLIIIFIAVSVFSSHIHAMRKKRKKKIANSKKTKKKQKKITTKPKATPKSKKIITKKKEKITKFYDYSSFIKNRNKISLKKAHAAISKSKNIGIMHCIFDTNNPVNPESSIFQKLKREYYGDVLYGYFIEQAKTVKAFQKNIELENGKIEHWFIITNKPATDKSLDILCALERVFTTRNWVSEKNLPLKHVLYPQNSLCSLDPEIMSSIFSNLYKQVFRKLYKKTCLNKNIPQIPILQQSDYAYI